MDHLNFPFRPYHPGKLLKEELTCRKISQRVMAKQLNVPYTAFNQVLNGKRSVSPDLALLLEASLGISASLLVRMQTDYNLQMASEDKILSKRLAEIRKMTAVL